MSGGGVVAPYSASRMRDYASACRAMNCGCGDCSLCAAGELTPREADEIADVIERYSADLAAAIARAEAAERDAARWRMCNGEHPLGDGEVAKVHVNVGVNVWRGEEWLSFEECSPEELEAVLAAIAAQQAEGA